MQLPTPEDGKRLEEELLKLNEKDIEVYKAVKEINGLIIPNKLRIYLNQDHNEVSQSLYKLYRNGKLKITNDWKYILT